jgi:hypothetical protein
VSDLPDWYARTLAHQKEMNPQTWAALQQRGVGEETLLRLEFFYDAPGRGAARALVRHLRGSTDYDVAAHAERFGRVSKRWMVVGRTPPSAVSAAILDDWVERMVAAGARHGPCRFDGWGASVS